MSPSLIPVDEHETDFENDYCLVAWIQTHFDGHSFEVKFINSEGKLENTLKQADTCAEYLRDKRWATPTTEYTGSTDPIHADTTIDMTPFTSHELDKAISKMKGNKSP